MSASLVGSEMCIRDRGHAPPGGLFLYLRGPHYRALAQSQRKHGAVPRRLRHPAPARPFRSGHEAGHVGPLAAQAERGLLVVQPLRHG
eukprot:834286-Alexandrium_andersonii.AAC.1